jgi:hypothetical protein
MMDRVEDNENKPQPRILIVWAAASVLIAILFFAHPARAPYWQRVSKFIHRTSN